MKIKYIGKTNSFILTEGKIYVERGCYRIIDDSGEDYLYPPECFEKISG